MGTDNQRNKYTTGSDLSLVPLEELLKEITVRHDAFVFAGKIHKNMQQYTITRKYHGHRDSCIAMASNLVHIINQEENRILGPIIE